MKTIGEITTRYRSHFLISLEKKNVECKKIFKSLKSFGKFLRHLKPVNEPLQCVNLYFFYFKKSQQETDIISHHQYFNLLRAFICTQGHVFTGLSWHVAGL